MKGKSEMTKRLNGQVLFALALAVVNTVYASQILQMARPFATGEPGPALMPSILCLFLYFGIARVLIGEFRSPAAETSVHPGSDTVPNIGVTGPLMAIGLIALFIIGFFLVGYLLASLVYTFLISLYFNYEHSGRWKQSALISLAISVGVTLFGWLFFVQLFDLYLPVWEL